MPGQNLFLNLARYGICRIQVVCVSTFDKQTFRKRNETEGVIAEGGRIAKFYNRIFLVLWELRQGMQRSNCGWSAGEEGRE